MAIYAFLQQAIEQFVFGKQPQGPAIYSGTLGREIIFGRNDHRRSLGQPAAIHAARTKYDKNLGLAVPPVAVQTLPGDKFDKGDNSLDIPGRHAKRQAEFVKRLVCAPQLLEYLCAGNS